MKTETLAKKRHKHKVSKIIGNDNFGVGRGTLVICSLAINMLSLALPITTLQIYDRIISTGGLATLNVLTAAVCVAVVLESILKFTRSYVTAWAGARFEHKVSCAAMKHILNADIREVEKQSSGEYLTKMAAISKLREFYSGHALMTLIDLPFVVIFLGLIGYLAGGLVVVPIIMLVMFVGMTMASGRTVRHTLARRDVRDDEKYNFVLETLSGIHTVKSGAFEPFFTRHYESLQTACSKENYKVATRTGQNSNYSYLFTNLLTVSMVAYGALEAANGQLSMGALVACVLLSGRIMQPVQRAMGFWTRYQDFELSLNQVDSIFDLPIRKQVEGHSESYADNSVELKNISYNFGNNNVLDKVTLELKKGECVAVTSESSNGKTTLLKLIAGVYAPSRGEVLTNEAHPASYSSEELVKHIGYLPTQGIIYRGTILENLTRFGQTPVEKAFEMSTMLGIDKEVAKLPNGYNTQLEGSIADNVPPGLKQRIAVARVLACRPKIILFDHADRALDKEGYNQFYRLFGRLKGKATMVIVSSDQNLLRLADRQYQLEDKKLSLMENVYQKRVVNLNIYKVARG